MSVNVTVRPVIVRLGQGLPRPVTVRSTKVQTIAKVERGPPGPPGTGGDSDVFEYSPPTPLSEWIVNHNFGRNPVVSVLSPGGVEVEAEVVHMTVNQARVRFNAPQFGKAIAR